MITPSPHPRGRPKVPVHAPDGRRFESITAAALAYGMRASSVWFNARLGKCGWSLAGAEPPETGGEKTGS